MSENNNKVPSYDELTEQQQENVRYYLDGMKAMQRFVVLQLRQKQCDESKADITCGHQTCWGIKAFIAELEGTN